jgi:hypothetical protein
MEKPSTFRHGYPGIYREEEMSQRAGLSNTLLVVVVVGVLAVFIYSVLTPVAEYLLALAGILSTTQNSADGISAMSTMWEYWPVYLLLLLMAYTYVRAVKESGQGR